MSTVCTLSSVELASADGGALPSFVSVSDTSFISVSPKSLEEIGAFSLKAILNFEDQKSVETPAFTINIIYKAPEEKVTSEGAKD